MQAPNNPGRHLIEVTSSIDNSLQPSYIILPPALEGVEASIPVVVSLHTWSFDLEQRNEELEHLVLESGWIYLFPNFRGRNDHPEACASELAKQDVIDVLDWVIARYPVDENRIYLTGISGGGHMTLAMVEETPAHQVAHHILG